MAKWLFLSIFLWIPVGAFFQIRAYRAFDRMLKNLYAKDYEAWVRLGKPAGWFWRPSEMRFTSYAATVARSVVSDTGAHMRLLVSSDPAFGSSVERAYYRPLRIAKICGALAAIAFIGAVALIPFS